MFEVIEQNISEARVGLTHTLRRMAGGENIVVIVRKRNGEPQGVLIPAPEAARYFEWIAEQLDSQIVKESQGSSQSAALNLSLPEGWDTPTEYARKCLAERYSPEAVFRGLKRYYVKHGLTHEAEARIVNGIRGEQGA